MFSQSSQVHGLSRDVNEFCKSLPFTRTVDCLHAALRIVDHSSSHTDGQTDRRTNGRKRDLNSGAFVK